MATQTLTFLPADIEGWAAMGRRLGDAHAGVRAGHRRLIAAGLAAPVGGEAGPGGDGVVAVFAWPGPRRPVAVADGG